MASAGLASLNRSIQLRPRPPQSSHSIDTQGTRSPIADFDFEGPNAHLPDYIKSSKGLKKPGFAVLVTGEWGTGKTRLIRQLLPWEGKDKQSYYVSFFGLKSAAEVDAAIDAEMYPRRSALTNASFQGHVRATPRNGRWPRASHP